MYHINSPYTGIDLERVRVFEGYLTEDGYETGNGSIQYRLRLERVTDQNGYGGDAAGVVIIYSDDIQVREWGAALRVCSALSFREGKGNDGYWSRADSGQLEQTGWKNPVFHYRTLLRASLISRIRRMGGRSTPLLEALLLGVRDDLNLFEEELFRRSGCMHILALSGMHLGILTGVLYLLLGLFCSRTVSSCITVGTVMVYVLLAGCKPSLMRAAVMVMLAWIGLLSGRKSHGFSLLLSSFVAVCLVFPDSWRTLSFQLSFLALAGIILFGNSIARRLSSFLPKLISVPLGCSVGAQLMTSGILIHRFQVLYPVGIAAALFITPLVTVFIWTGLAYLLLADLPVVSFFLSRLADMIYHIIVLWASWFSRMPGLESGDLRNLIIYFAAIAVLLWYVYIPKVRKD